MPNTISAPDLTKRPPRSARCRLGGYVLLPRMLDKGRAEIAGMAGEFHYDCPLDNIFFDFAGLKGAARGTAYYASKFALRGMTECWRDELRKHNVRVMLVNPSEVLTDFSKVAGFEQKENPTKLRSEDIAHMVKAILEMDDRGFTPELSIFATNPKN